MKLLVILIINISGYVLALSITFFLSIVGIILIIFKLNRIKIFFVKLWSNLIFLIFFKRIEVKGIENIDSRSNYIAVMNHSSAFDIPAIMSILPDICWFGRDRYLKIPVFGLLLKKMNYIGINTNSQQSVYTSIQKALDSLKMKNITIGIFPEGTRSKNGEIGNFKKGFLFIARNAKMDILPITLNGFYRFKAKNKIFVNPFTRLQIVISKPIKYDEYKDLEDNVVVNLVRECIVKNYYI